MAQLLVRVTDKVSPDIYQNAKLTKRGDVIAVQADDWQWGTKELTEPFWRIVKHTGVSVSEAEAFLAPEPEVDPQNPSRTLQRRAFKLNIDAAVIPAMIRDWLNDNTRAVPVFDVTALIPLNAFRALKLAKPPIADPNVIG